MWDKACGLTTFMAQAQANPTCPYADNLVAEAVQSIINTYRVNESNLQDVIIVGDDDIIPFFRYPDNAGLAPESDYEPPLSSTTAAHLPFKTTFS